MRLILVLEKTSNLFNKVSETICGLFLVVVFFTLFFQVIARSFLGFNFPWAEELSRYLMVWVAMLGASILVKSKELISVDFFESKWTGKWDRYRKLLFTTIMLIILCIMIYEGFFQAIHGRKVFLASLKGSMFLPYMAVPVGFTIMLFHYLVEFSHNITRKNI